jgi:Tfp pilus assembly protein PilV
MGRLNIKAKNESIKFSRKLIKWSSFFSFEQFIFRETFPQIKKLTFPFKIGKDYSPIKKKYSNKHYVCYKNTGSGITLIGVVIALCIMSSGLVALLVLVNSTLVAAINARGDTEANSLRYDAFEALRNIRDTNILSKSLDQSGYDVWDNGTAGSFKETGSYLVNCDLDNCVLTKKNNSTTFIEPKEQYSDYRLLQNKDNGIINHDANGKTTRFYRQIIIKEPCLNPDAGPINCTRPVNDNLKEVIVYITWIELNGTKRTIEGHTYIGNWNVDDL